MVFERVKSDAGIGEFAQHFGVSRERGRFIVMVRQYRLHTELFGQFDDFRHGMPMPDQQSSGGVIRHGAPSLVKFLDSAVNEADPPVMGGQTVQDVAVKHKATKHFVAVLDRGVQSGMVVHAQIPPEPDQYRRKMCEMSACHLHP